MTDTPTVKHSDAAYMLQPIDGDGPTCWTAGCDDEATWRIALFKQYPFNTGPVLPVKARCRVHTFELRRWWLRQHDGEVVISQGVL